MCEREFSKPTKESWEQWETREFCSKSCGNQKDIKARLSASSEMNEAGCLIWKGGIGTGGYGTIIVRRGGIKKYLRVHRVAFEEYCRPIPDGLIVMHTCDVPACINPLHLKLGSHADNMADKVAKGRHRTPIRGANGATRINDAGVVTILESRLPAQTLAAAFCVTACTINRIRREARRAQRV